MNINCWFTVRCCISRCGMIDMIVFTSELNLCKEEEEEEEGKEAVSTMINDHWLVRKRDICLQI